MPYCAYSQRLGLKRNVLITIVGLCFFGFVASQASAQVVLQKVDYLNDVVEIKNLGADTVDINSWWLCSRFSYQQISSLTVESGSVELALGDSLVVSGLTLNDASADLGLYIDINNNFGNFGNPAFMASFVQWGAGNIGRASVAVNRHINRDRDMFPLFHIA